MVTGLMRIIDYIGPNGEARFMYKFDGAQSVTETIGMLHRAAFSYAFDIEQEGD